MRIDALSRRFCRHCGAALGDGTVVRPASPEAAKEPSPTNQLSPKAPQAIAALTNGGYGGSLDDTTRVATMANGIKLVGGGFGLTLGSFGLVALANATQLATYATIAYFAQLLAVLVIGSGVAMFLWGVVVSYRKTNSGSSVPLLRPDKRTPDQRTAWWAHYYGEDADNQAQASWRKGEDLLR